MSTTSLSKGVRMIRILNRIADKRAARVTPKRTRTDASTPPAPDQFQDPGGYGSKIDWFKVYTHNSDDLVAMAGTWGGGRDSDSPAWNTYLLASQILADYPSEETQSMKSEMGAPTPTGNQVKPYNGGGPGIVDQTYPVPWSTT